ncbi:hypothetical protein [Halostella sp. PRR32]|uniref:hypothetical protein n=1 Tax=Halostella sp. PRR32 TaxID=3098147 RepID=UPI002B1DBDCC|nr:hypothetical protein [Halostella sp. PRR32]
MRKHFYLITEHPNEDRVGQIEVTSQRKTPSSKNEETACHKMRFDEERESIEDRFTQMNVSIGYYDFEDEDGYQEQASDVVQSKLEEIDEEHLRKAGLDPEEVFADA